MAQQDDEEGSRFPHDLCEGSLIERQTPHPLDVRHFPNTKSLSFQDSRT